MSNIDADPSQEDGQKITIDDYRAAMDRAAKAEKRAEQADRTSAMAIAGIPTGTAPGAAFVEKYTGKLDDVDAIHAAAVEWGLWKPEGSDANTDKVTPADQAQIDADRQLLQQGGTNPDLGQEAPARHPGEEGLEAFYAGIGQGRTREMASSEVINRLTVAAINNDPRVIIVPER